MPNVGAGDIAEVTIGYKYQGQQCLMTRHYRLQTLPATVDYLDWMQNIINALTVGGVNVTAKLAACQHESAVQNFI